MIEGGPLHGEVHSEEHPQQPKQKQQQQQQQDPELKASQQPKQNQHHRHEDTMVNEESLGQEVFQPEEALEGEEQELRYDNDDEYFPSVSIDGISHTPPPRHERSTCEQGMDSTIPDLGNSFRQTQRDTDVRPAGGLRPEAEAPTIDNSVNVDEAAQSECEVPHVGELEDRQGMSGSRRGAEVSVLSYMWPIFE